MYPPTVINLRFRLQDYPAYAATSDERLQLAIDSARGELESAVPALTDTLLSPLADLMSYTLCLDLAVWHIKRAVERTEDGDVPPALWRERQDLNRRLENLARLFDSFFVEALGRLEEEAPYPS